MGEINHFKKLFEPRPIRYFSRALVSQMTKIWAKLYIGDKLVLDLEVS